MSVLLSIARARSGEASDPKTGASPPAQELLGPALRALVAEARAAAQRVAVLAPRAEAEDPEAIHDLRVAIRRLRTVLRPVRPLYGRRRLRAIGDGLRRVADATGSLRDEEVLRETLGALELPDATRAVLIVWMVSRHRREQASRASVVRLLKPRPPAKPRARETREKKANRSAPAPQGFELLDRCLHRLERRLDRTKRRDVAYEDLLDQAIAGARADVATAAAAAHPTDALAMHALRIRWKRLRYTAELFSEQEPPGARREQLDRLGKRAARMQKRLGEVHDFDEAIIRLRRAWGLPAAARHVVIALLEAAREGAANRAITEVVAELASWPSSEAAP